ncbi:hypothetical protein ACOIPL_001299 [Vibrio fluvialis]
MSNTAICLANTEIDTISSKTNMSNHWLSDSELSVAKQSVRSINELPPISSSLNLKPKDDVSTLVETLTAPSTIEDVEIEFYCIVDHVDRGHRSLDATVYNKQTSEIEMSLNLDFDDFLPSDQNLLRENAVFYWKIGVKHVTKFSQKKGCNVTQSSNFSEFRVKRAFVKPESVSSRLNKEMDMINFVLG